jgi:hypothetical protein
VSPTVSITILLLLFVPALVGMLIGWRRRVRTSAALVGDLPPVPDDAALGPELCPPAAGTYVSTTAADWLDRVAAHDLGVRSAAEVHVHRAGVLIARRGARDLFLPTASLTSVGAAPGIAGKVVGRDGLVVIGWRGPAGDRGPAALQTGLRLRHRADQPVVTDAIAGLVRDHHEEHA